MRWDYHCPTCQRVYERWFPSVVARDAASDLCPHDQTLLVRVPSAVPFSIRGYSAANGYNKKD